MKKWDKHQCFRKNDNSTGILVPVKRGSDAANPFLVLEDLVNDLK